MASLSCKFFLVVNNVKSKVVHDVGPNRGHFGWEGMLCLWMSFP